MTRILNDKGVTLLEVTIALALFIILTMTSFTVMVNLSSLTGKLAARQELMENARFAIDAITTSVRMSSAIRLRQRDDGSLLRLDVYDLHTNNKNEKTDLYFQYNSSVANTNRILQGNNELASYISRCDVSINGDIMRIYIETETLIDGNSIEIPIVFVRDIDIRYKEKK